MRTAVSVPRGLRSLPSDHITRGGRVGRRLFTAASRWAPGLWSARLAIPAFCFACREGVLVAWRRGVGVCVSAFLQGRCSLYSPLYPYLFFFLLFPDHFRRYLFSGIAEGQGVH